MQNRGHRGLTVILHKCSDVKVYLKSYIVHVCDSRAFFLSLWDSPSSALCHQYPISLGASLIVQWLRTCLPMQETWVQILVWKDPTCHGATQPVCYDYWASALKSLCSSKRCLHLPQREKVHAQQWRSSIAKNKYSLPLLLYENSVFCCWDIVQRWYFDFFSPNRENGLALIQSLSLGSCPGLSESIFQIVNEAKWACALKAHWYVHNS